MVGLGIADGEQLAFSGARLLEYQTHMRQTAAASEKKRFSWSRCYPSTLAPLPICILVSATVIDLTSLRTVLQ